MGSALGSLARVSLAAVVVVGACAGGGASTPIQSQTSRAADAPLETATPSVTVTPMATATPVATATPAQSESTSPTAQQCARPGGDRSALPAFVQAYANAWRERDADARRALLDEVWAADGTYADAMAGVPAKGIEALSTSIATFQGRWGSLFQPWPWSPTDQHHDRFRMRWRLCQATGPTLLFGEDIGVLDSNGRVREVTRFSEVVSIRTPQKACAGRAGSDGSQLPEIVRGYSDAWTAIGNLGQPVNRLVLLEDIWAEDGYYVDPLVAAPVIGRHAFSVHMRHALASWDAGHYFEVREWTGNDLHHDRLRIPWRICCPTGEILVEGDDIGEIDRDGRISRVTSFWNNAVELPADRACG